MQELVDHEAQWSGYQDNYQEASPSLWEERAFAEFIRHFAMDSVKGSILFSKSPFKVLNEEEDDNLLTKAETFFNKRKGQIE